MLQHRRIGQGLTSVALTALLCSLAASPLLANTLLVTDLGDNTAGSLRQAIALAATGDTIQISPALAGTITLTSGSLHPLRDMTILGTQAQLVTISGNDVYSVFFLPVPMNIKVTNLTLAHGGAAITNGVALTLEDCVWTNSKTGAISNSGVLTLNRCTISGNTGTSKGAGIENLGTLTANSCTISNNTLTVGVDGDGGAGIYTNGTATLVQTTVFGNTNTPPGGTAQTGAGILVAGGTLDMTNCTIAANSANMACGVSVLPGAGPVTVKSTIIANNLDDIGGTFVSGGYNLIGAAGLGSGFGPGTHDQVGSFVTPLDPGLGPLQDNGGPTFTCLPLPGGSPAVDQGRSSFPTDQRGHPRRYDFSIVANGASSDGSDIGACEAAPATPWLVTNTLDHGPGSLRQAIITAAPGEVVQCSASSEGTITLTSGELIVNKGLDIEGPGAKLEVVDGGHARPDFDLDYGNITLRGFSLIDAGPVNGCIYIGPSANVTLDQDAIAHNPCSGVYNNGALSASRCAFVQNNAHLAPGIAGGGLYNTGGVTLTDCTVASDSSRWGGGIDNYGGNIILFGCTVSGNIALLAGTPSRIGGGIYNESGTVTLASTIVAGNTAVTNGPDVLGDFGSGHFNLIGKSDGSTGLVNGAGGDQVGSIAAPLNALLGPLADNGGQTPTMLPQTGSPAIDAGESHGELSDQRGAVRTFDDLTVPNSTDGTDVGASEVVTYAVAVPPLSHPALQLAAVSPNPARGAMAVEYTVPSEERLDLSVFDVEGRRVRSLVSGEEPAGKHVAKWDGTASNGDRVPSGIYWLRLGAGGQLLTRRFALIQ